MSSVQKMCDDQQHTMSSWTSLNADASNTTASGAMVVYRLVGETPGICCIHAVNKKKRLAYFENCSIECQVC